MKSPFKFLDSFTLADRDIFFGRDQEISDLYRRTFAGKILLVYGNSGTGKSSLINCGLASRFDESDWLPVNVRRGNNIIESLNEAFNKTALTDLKENLTVSDKLQSVYLDHFKPVFFIFDQFEELFIFGSEEEKSGFKNIIKELVESETQCRIIFIIREEYLAGITEFESDIPEIFYNRFRIEKMKRADAIRTIEGPCKVNGIETDPGFSEGIIDKLCQAGNEIELTFLQIYLDRIFRIAGDEKPASAKLKFSLELLNKAGSVSDLLGQFLEEQIRELENPEIGMSILKSFVSVRGTRRQMKEAEIFDSLGAFGTVISEDDLLKYLSRFVDLRILREKDEAGYFDLKHDSLAAKIYEKFTAIEKDIIEVKHFIDNAFSFYEKRGKLLNSEDLKYIAPYEDRLFLDNKLVHFILKSKNDITRSRKRIRNIAALTGLALILILSGFTVWALNEKRKSNQNYLIAEANNYNFLSQKVVEVDPTVALRLAEYAISIDSVNPDIVQNLNRIYYDFNFYRIVSRHENNIISVSFSPDGKSILSGSQDSTARLWDLQGNLLQSFKGHQGIINSVNFSPDGKTVLTGSADKTAWLWNLRGEVLQKFEGHKGIVYSTAFSPDGKTILTGSSDKTARLWDLNGTELQLFEGHKDIISSVAFSGDGQTILTGSNDKTARLWDLKGRLLKVFTGHERGITSVAISPNGKEILTGSMDGTSRLYKIGGDLLSVYKGHDNIVTSVAFSKDGRSIITGSWDKTIRLSDLQGNLLRIFKGHEGEIESVAFSPDGKSIISGSDDKTARLWDIDGVAVQTMRGHEEAINSVAFSDDGKKIVTGSNDKTAILWDLQGNILQVFLGHDDGIWSVAFSPDGTTILTASADSTARLWDLNGNILKELKGHTGIVWCAAFSPDGKYILTGSEDKTARLWDLNGNAIHVFEGHKGSVTSAVFSPDNRNILTGSWDNSVRLWNVDGTLIRIFHGSDYYINSVGFSPDGKNVVTGSWDKTVRLWDLQGNLIQTFNGNDGYVSSVTFSPDGKNLLTVSSPGDDENSASLWDLQGNVLQIFKGHEGRINSVAFSPDGKSVLTGSWDNTARVWKIKTPHKEFERGNSYQVLSITQKIRFGILDFNGVVKLNDEKSLKEAAEYYYNGLDKVSKKDKSEYLGNALILYGKLLNEYKDEDYKTKKASLTLIRNRQKDKRR